VKDLRVYWTVRALVLAVALIVSVMLASSGPAGAADQSKKKASVQIGFLGGVTTPQNFQSVLLNVQAVRINPNSSAGPGDNKWQVIPVPPGIGGGAGHPGDLQIDLNTALNVPLLFNSAFVRPDKYVIAELLLDPTNPGTIIPVCPGAPSSGEGCINYPIRLANAGNPITVVAPTGTLVSPLKESLSTLILKVQVDVQSPVPTISGNPYTVNVTLSLPETNDELFATVTGTVTPSGGTVINKKGTRKLTVTAETAGTNTVISTSPISAKSMYTLALPAAGEFGSLYDLTVSGGGAKYAATRLPAITQGQVVTSPFTATLGQSLGNITGKISEACAGQGISGATLQLFVAPLSNPSADCTSLATIGECVSVATANTDNSGQFPLPGTAQIPAPFNNVPILKAGDTYSMLVTAPGYDPLFTPVNATHAVNGGNCSASTPAVKCDLTLKTGFITGSFLIDSPLPGETVLVQVFAEDAGSNKIESALPMPVVVRPGTGNFFNYTINVPPSVPAFDLFATTIDLFQGVSDPYQGHSIAVLKNVASPGEPTASVCGTTNATTPPDTITCVGHGSINGTVANADLGTSVVLIKEGVQITSTPVQNVIQSSTAPTTNTYNFCVPADTYDVQRFQVAQQSTSTAVVATPTPTPAGVPHTVIIPPPPIVPTPGATPTPFIRCPTTCSHPDGTCPGNCNSATPPFNPL
jgi:hypothetical protein